MSNIKLSDFKDLYLQTAHEYIQKMQTALAVLHDNPSDPVAIETIHLSSHSLKSQSLVMGYQTTGELCHIIELYFRPLKENKGQVEIGLLSLLQESVGQLRESLESISKDGKEVNLLQTIMNLQEKTGVRSEK